MKLRSMTRCALFAALCAVCAWLAVPLGDIAVTMQTFAVLLTLGVLGGRLGTVTLLVYLCLGATGLPVFSGFQGGFGVLLGPTGGYLWGFPVAGLIYLLLEKRLPPWLNMAVGMLVCYLCGTVWYYFAYTETGLWVVILKCVVPYLIPDTVKLLLAADLTQRLRSLLK